MPSRTARYLYDMLVLRVVARLDGTPTASEQRITVTETMRQLGIEPGNVITFTAQVDAYTLDGKRIAADIEGEIEPPPGITYRLSHARNVDLVAYRG